MWLSCELWERVWEKANFGVGGLLILQGTTAVRLQPPSPPATEFIGNVGLGVARSRNPSPTTAALALFLKLQW